MEYVYIYALRHRHGNPADLRIVCDSINRPGDLDLWPFDL